MVARWCVVRACTVSILAPPMLSRRSAFSTHPATSAPAWRNYGGSEATTNLKANKALDHASVLWNRKHAADLVCDVVRGGRILGVVGLSGSQQKDFFVSGEQ